MKTKEAFPFRQVQGEISSAVNQVVPNLQGKKDEEDIVIKSTWTELDAIRGEIAAYTLVMVESVEKSIALVRNHGCYHPNEFEVVAKATQLDLERFMKMYEDIAAKHAGKTGPIANSDEHVSMLSIFEEYVALKTLIDGTLQPSMVAFTEYALEAKDMALEKVKAQTTTSQEGSKE